MKVFFWRHNSDILYSNLQYNSNVKSYLTKSSINELLDVAWDMWSGIFLILGQSFLQVFLFIEVQKFPRISAFRTQQLSQLLIHTHDQRAIEKFFKYFSDERVCFSKYH